MLRATAFNHGSAVCTVISALYTWGRCTVMALGCRETLMSPVLLWRPWPSLYCRILSVADWLSLRTPMTSGTIARADCASRTGVLLYLSMYGWVVDAMVLSLGAIASALI